MGKKIKFTINERGEEAAGIRAFSETVIIEVESGDPGGEEGEFEEFMLDALCDWFDGAEVSWEVMEDD